MRIFLHIYSLKIMTETSGCYSVKAQMLCVKKRREPVFINYIKHIGPPFWF